MSFQQLITAVKICRHCLWTKLILAELGKNTQLIWVELSLAWSGFEYQSAIGWLAHLKYKFFSWTVNSYQSAAKFSSGNWLMMLQNSTQFGSLSVVIGCQAVIKINFRNWLRDSRTNYMPKISLTGWVRNFALFWQLFSCHELSSCHKKVLTPEMNWGISNLTVCQKSVWLVEFEILPYFDSLSVVKSCQAVIEKKRTSKIDWGIANLAEC